MTTPVFLRMAGRVRSRKALSGLYCRPRGCNERPIEHEQMSKFVDIKLGSSGWVVLPPQGLHRLNR